MPTALWQGADSVLGTERCVGGYLSDYDDSVHLLRWSADDRIPDESYARLESHPNFARAMRALSTNMLAAAESDPALDAIVKDLGRFVATTWAVCLDADGGLTLPRLKRVSQTSGLLSAGRARAVLLFLRYLRYIVPVEGGGPPQHFRPTPALMKAWQRLINARLEAACLIEPAARLVADRLDDPHVLRTYLRYMGQGVLTASANASIRDTPFVRQFVHHYAGVQMIHSIITAARDDDLYPPRQAVPFSVAGAARRLRVSRTQIKRLLSDAEQRGMLTCSPGGEVVLAESLRESIHYMMLTVMIGSLICAAKTCRDLQAESSRRDAGRHGAIGDNRESRPQL